MTSTAGCLSEETVLAFMEGRLSDAALEAVDRHLDGCAECQAVLFEAGGQASPEGSMAGTEVSLGRPRSFLDRPAIANDTVLAGRYRIVRFIGAGGMGEVYEAEDTVLREHIALKTVNAFIADHPRAVARLKREVLLARRVTHPNVCRIFDFSFHDNIAFLTMELLAGETLGARLRRVGRVSPEEALLIANQLAEALEAAHAAGVVHRDFKSDNVMLVVSETSGNAIKAVVTDFGLARSQLTEPSSSHHQQTSARPLVGTISHMAPEQIEGLEVTPRTDIYALGIVLYEMVTGRLPFVARSPISSAIKRLTGPPPSPRSVVPELPLQWESTILQCLEREPERRFASARLVVESLRAEVPAPRNRAKHIAVGFGLALVSAGVLLMVSLQKSRIEAVPLAKEPPVAATPPRNSATAIPKPPAPGRLIVRTDAKDARIAVDGKELSLNDGRAEVSIETPGSHSVSVSAPNQAAIERTVEVAEGATVHLEVPLEARSAAAPAKSSRPIRTSNRPQSSVNPRSPSVPAPQKPAVVTGDDDGVIDPYRSTR